MKLKTLIADEQKETHPVIVSAETIFTRTATICKEPNGIISLIFKPEMHVDYKDMLDNFQAIKHPFTRKKKLLLIDGRAFGLTLDIQAMNFIESKNDRKRNLAVAILTHVLINPELLSFFKYMSSSKVPTSVFSDQDKAIVWLRSF